MQVTLKFATPLDYIKDGIRMCWDSSCKSDNMGPNDLDLIDRIANKNKHSSVLRHSIYIFEIEASTKTLLAFTRHKAGVDFSVQSTRYTTKKRKDNLSYTSLSDPSRNEKLNRIMSIVLEAIDEGWSNDDISMLLPQAYNYTFQVSMNAQAIQHFLSLRTSKGAHYDIRNLANAIYESLPDSHKYLFTHTLKDSYEH